ncbi:MAG: hypothetical protein AAF518_11790 [Spirochaetota bacterium]
MSEAIFTTYEELAEMYPKIQSFAFMEETFYVTFTSGERKKLVFKNSKAALNRFNRNCKDKRVIGSYKELVNW